MMARRFQWRVLWKLATLIGFFILIQPSHAIGPQPQDPTDSPITPRRTGGTQDVSPAEGQCDYVCVLRPGQNQWILADENCAPNFTCAPPQEYCVYEDNHHCLPLISTSCRSNP